jgi:ribosomal protein S27AE
MDETIEELTEKVGRTIEESEEQFRKCPKCGLPTFMEPGKPNAYCARCNEYFEIRGKGPKSRLKHKDRKVPMRSQLILLGVGVVIMILLVSGAFYHFVSMSDIGYIDIHDINEVRGLPEAEDVPKTLISQGELEDMIHESVDDDERDRLWEMERFYKCLFIIPETWDLVDIVENESSGAGIAGFYDTEEEEMYIVGEMHTTSYVNYILSHEYTHALQDQNFDLDDYMDGGGYDQEFARLCAIEGDAVMTMDIWAEENLDDSDILLAQFESIAQALSTLDYDGTYYNEILGEMSYYPYEGGLTFVERVYDDGGWEAVNALFTTRPPLSSEQVMHYEKYRDYEAPLDVSFSSPPENYSLKFTSVVGEKLLSEILYYNIGYYFYTGAGFGRGWGGDRFYYYEDGDDFLSVIATRWDSEMDNQRFENDISSMFDDIGSMEGDIYNIRGNYLTFTSSGDSTTIYYGSSAGAVMNYLG